MTPRPPPSERAIVFLVGAVQFVNILDFLMVMPLGPDFARALGIPTSQLGYVGGSYTAAAAVSGLLGSLVLDRFDRRAALGVAMAGLVVGTAAGGFAVGLTSLLAARVVAGFFGGPATSIAFSIIADVIPAERRGRAMGSVMGAFSVASVLGVPAGLRLALWGGWRTPFFAVAALGLLVAGSAVASLPPLVGHIEARRGAPPPSFSSLLGRGRVRLSYAMTATVMMAGFIVIPNISAYVQGNLGFPRSRLEVLYLVGGVVTFATLRALGRLVDRLGSFRVGSAASVLLVGVVYAGFYVEPPPLPVLPLYVLFMIALSTRNVSYNTLTSKVPAPAERARFMSLQSSIQHASSAAGAFLSARLLAEAPTGRLVGMPRVAAVSMALTAVLPLLLRAVEGRQRAAGGSSSSGA